MKLPILLADGDVELCDLYPMFLTDCSCDGETAVDGLECLEKWRQMNPEVLVLDLGRRGRGGDDVYNQIRAIRQ